MTASPGDGERAAREGYYPDPSIPGYVRYWNGAAWVPGTSRPAPDLAPARVPAPVPFPAPVEETGPVFLDRTSATEAVAEPVAGRAVWQADPVHQAGFGGPRDHRVSWGSPPEPEPVREAEPEREPEREPEPEPERERTAEPVRESVLPVRAPAAGISLARTPSAPAGILPARSPAVVAPALPAAPSTPAWPDAPGGSGASGLTSSWPETAPAAAEPRPVAEPRPASVEPRPVAERRPASVEPRPVAERRPVAEPGPAPEPRPAEVRPEPWQPRSADAGPSVQATRAAAPVPAEPRAEAPAPRREGAGTPRAVFERMAERAVRPAGLVRRTVARAVDCLVLAGVAAAAAWPQVPVATAHLRTKVDAARTSGRTTTVWLLDGTIAGHLVLVLGAVLLFGVFYEALPTARWGRTPGKKLLGVRVLSTATLRPPTVGAALRRWLLFVLLGLPGSLWCLADRPRRRAWHDRAAKTYVGR